MRGGDRGFGRRVLNAIRSGLDGRRLGLTVSESASSGQPPSMFVGADIRGSLAAEAPVSLANTIFDGACRIGAFSYLNVGCDVSETDIGRYCSIARGVVIGPGEHPIQFLTTHPVASDPSGVSSGMLGDPAYQAVAGTTVSKPAAPQKRTRIGDDVWIGANAVILKGVEIGTGAVIGAGAVVTKDVAPYAIVVGVPAKTLRFRFDDALISRLLESKWWTRDLSAMPVRDFSDPEGFLNVLASVNPAPLWPKTVSWPPAR